MGITPIPFNRPYIVGGEFAYMQQAIDNMHLSGDGPFTKQCHTWLEASVRCARAYLTHSCTAALEMAAILADIESGDEVIMPSYTFVSTANAFVLRGAVPVFVDIRPDTLNLDEDKIEASITRRTKAIVPVHYAGVSCEMDTINAIAERHGLFVIEDAAQGLMASYNGRALGSMGHAGALSFHETKNVMSGEGGALLINEPRWVERAEIIREKGTNRRKFLRGEVDKYSWVDVGSSWLPSELIAAFLRAQLEHANQLTELRLAVWERYHEAFADLEARGKLRRPVIPTHCRHNAHMYYLVLEDLAHRTMFLDKLKAAGIHALFHYVPLHSSPAGRRYARAHGELIHTDAAGDRLVRLPLWVEMTEDDVGRVIDAVAAALR